VTADDQQDDAHDVDLLVVGGGMAGLTAAAAAATRGARVMVVEKGDHVGGSAVHAGFAWTAPSVEVLREQNPGGDPDLGAALVTGFPGGVEWIRSLGVDCRPPVTILRFGRGHQFDTGHYLARCERRVVERDGAVLTRAQPTSLHVTGGAVTGADVRLPDGSVRRVAARWTLLATGGYQADPDLRADLIHPNARDLALRGNPWSSGDGLRLGRSAGAAFGAEGAGFYGHLVPAGVPLSDPSLFVDLALYYSEHALLFNLAGERFVDETAGDHLTTIALVAQPEARGLLVADAAAHRNWITQSYVEGAVARDTFALASRRGARCAIAGSLDEFDEMPPEWGYPGARIRAAIEELNAALERGGDVSPDRRHDRTPLREGPFYVVEAAPAITFTFGGLLVDADARVRSQVRSQDGGTVDGGTVPGLLAAGADAGGLYDGAYAGGLAAALVFGLAAARTATRDL
jgi:succinate dehydrogenase/fumarate reductase flavoprotein subunit